jgi:twitching motility protein PilU
MLTPQQLEELDDTGELNVAVSIAKVGSFRLSAFKQRGSIAAVFRCIPHTTSRRWTRWACRRCCRSW